ncbi:MAG: peptidoglycan-binding protein [Rhodanobacter sp.]|nr:MAG: peptidoglycan-binding protein [Rhodanobacter sp.]
MSILSGQKASLKIVACTVSGDSVTPGSDSVSLLINPAELSLKRKTEFSRCVPMGDPGSGRNFSRMQPDTLSFVTVFDGTGAVPLPANLLGEVEDQLDALSKIVYAYDGQQHQPDVVQIVWGTLLFTGRLTSLDIDYTLFKPSGAPLRAKVSMSFQGYKSRQEAILEAAPASPDLSHRVVVKDGDTLPLLCHRIYGDSGYYVDVARFNGLPSFRRLTPGSTLHFPPLG